MGEQDATLQYWSERIDSLSSEYERAKSNTSHFHDQMESAWGSHFMICRKSIGGTKSRQLRISRVSILLEYA